MAFRVIFVTIKLVYLLIYNKPNNMKILQCVLMLTTAALLASCGGQKKETTDTAQTNTTADSLKVAAGSYRNEALGYTITYPKDILTLQENAENNQEQIFIPAEGTAQLRIFADKRIDKKTGKELTFNEAYDQDAADGKNRQVVQRSLNPTNYVVAGVEGNKIFYQKTLMKNNSLVTAKLTYSKEEKKTFDAIIASMFGSFR